MSLDPARIRQLREQRAWSQEQLAEIAGVSVRTVQRVENGGNAALDTRMALAAALEVTPQDLMVAEATAMPTSANESAAEDTAGGDVIAAAPLAAVEPPLLPPHRPGVTQLSPAAIAEEPVLSVHARPKTTPPAPDTLAPPPGSDQQSRHEEMRAFWIALLAVLSTLVLLIIVGFGYVAGRDMAHKHNRAACEAAGRSDCR